MATTVQHIIQETGNLQVELLLSTDMRATVPHARFGLPAVH